MISIDTLLARVKRLNSDETRILYAFAVVYEPVNQTQMKQILTQVGWESASGRGLDLLMAKPLRDKLVQAKLLHLHQNRYFCHPDLMEVLARRAQAEGFFRPLALAARRVVPFPDPREHWGRVSEMHIRRQLREALHSDDEAGVFSLLGAESKGVGMTPETSALLVEFCVKPFSATWFATLPDSIQYVVLNSLLRSGAADPEQCWSGYLQARCEDGGTPEFPFHQLLAEWHLRQGRVAGVDQLLAGDDSWFAQALLGWQAFLQGKYGTAIDAFESALVAMRKGTRKRKVMLSGRPAVLFLLALLQSDDAEHQRRLDECLTLVKRNGATDPMADAYLAVGELVSILRGGLRFEDSWYFNAQHRAGAADAVLIYCLALHWLGEAPQPEDLRDLAVLAVNSLGAGMNWLASESAALMQALGYKNTAINGLAELLDEDVSGREFVSLLPLIRPLPAWERALQALQALERKDDSRQPQSSEPQTRLVWWLAEEYGTYELRPREQKRTKQGGWTKGRAVALKRLSGSDESSDGLTPEDLRICQCIRREVDYGYYGTSHYYLDHERALQAAAGHPHLYWAGAPDAPVEVYESEPELVVKAKHKAFALQLVPAPEPDGPEGLVILREGSHKLRLTSFDSQHYQIANILGPDGLLVPLAARAQVLESISAIAPLLTIHSDIGGGDSSAGVEVPADCRIHLHIQPVGEGLKFACYVQPFALGGPLFRPGEGGTTVLAEIDGQRLQTTRELDAECAARERLLAHCPALDDSGWAGEWQLGEDQALEALCQLQPLADQVVLSWPKGGRLQLHQEAGVAQMQVAVGQQRDWFTVDGELTYGEDNDQVLALERLLELVRESPGRFVRLGDDQFLALTQQLRQRLEGLHSHGERFHPLAVGALEELTAGMAVTADQPWQAQLARLREAHAQQPPVPATLQAQLRDYQQEGFEWLARLSHWGAGACLADDMGLGKTVQSLALLLTRAPVGPALILAPTSVCMNWLDEIERFAPTLKAQRFGPGDRQSMLQNAGPFDVIVCSYGLLQNEAERLTEIDWHTVVADEAQAIKNANTKRARAALALKGAFKMVTTGTPIENHLGELWSLFQFINPGLLGSLESFNSRFAGPIENQRDAAARGQLKRLIQPFVLRRLKTEVLTELPPRTEITLRVPLGKEEAALYEALRRKALEQLTEADDNPGQQRMKVLAEIMRLRRACCNPRLAMPESNFPSAKLQAFGEILDELLENQHRALVFSQFVDHLALLREYLDERGIRYQYLDGSTSVKRRQAAVQAFQAGEGELFLISLKAGGSGLNLTAADYVIHMDPWWNPAVEDQASDRAHRLGQQRPVTIYRLVAENTIEDKIVALHQHKRDLASSLLEGSELSGKLSLDEIVSLIEGD